MDKPIAGVNSRHKLVLHLDVNNTVLIGDSLTKSITPEEALNEYLTDVAWGQVDETGVWKGDGKISLIPPEKNLVSYYKFAEAKYKGKPRHCFKSHIRRFTEEAIGKPFRQFYDQMIDALEFPGNIKSGNGNDLPSFRDKNSVPFHCIVPSFYTLLDHLIESSREFAVIFRTFGRDGRVVLQATRDYLEGKSFNVKSKKQHEPQASELPVQGLAHDVNFSMGEITRSSNQITMKCPEDHLVLSNLWDIYKYFSQTNGVKLFVDDYEWWKAQEFNSLGAKPLLIDPGDDSVHHVMFDDNFRPNEPEDSVVNLLLAKKGRFSIVDPVSFDNVCVVKADLYHSICNRNYFIEKIEQCERNYYKFISEEKN